MLHTFLISFICSESVPSSQNSFPFIQFPISKSLFPKSPFKLSRCVIIVRFAVWTIIPTQSITRAQNFLKQKLLTFLPCNIFVVHFYMSHANPIDDENSKSNLIKRKEAQVLEINKERRFVMGTIIPKNKITRSPPEPTQI